MAAADYYSSGSSNSHKFSAPAPSSSFNSNKPLPHPDQTPYPHAQGSGYNDDLSYAPHHYSKHSVDTVYDPHSYDSHEPQKPEHSYADNIPLRPTHNQQHTMSSAEAEGGGFPPTHHKKKKKPRAPPIPNRRPWFCYFMTVVHVAVFCGELARNAHFTKSPIAVKPYFNPLIGPSQAVLINMGGRYVPCMRFLELKSTDVTTLKWPCPNSTSEVGECELRDLCGFGGNKVPETISKSNPPGQWWRFIVPMFLHVGLIHLLFNMFVQVTLGGDMERTIGIIRFAIVYFVSGIFGFVLGGNLGSNGQVSVGASGCLFGVFALVLLDILYTWGERRSPKKDLGFLMLDIVISFVLGLLPFIDNFAHIGGFVSGLAMGIAFMHSPNVLRKRIGVEGSDPPYTAATPGNPLNSSTGDNDLTGINGFVKQPLGFFKGRKPLWWAWWLVRAAVIALTLTAFIVMLDNFYRKNGECKWCKYLSCVPISNWCDMFDLDNQVAVTNTTTQNPARLLLRSAELLKDI